MGGLDRVVKLATRSYSLFPLLGLATCFILEYVGHDYFVIFVWCLWTEQLSWGHIGGLGESASVLGGLFPCQLATVHNYPPQIRMKTRVELL